MACGEECNRQLQGLMSRISRAETDIANQALSTAAMVQTLATTVPSFAASAAGTALIAAFQFIPNIGLLIEEMVKNLLPITSIDIKNINVNVAMMLADLLAEELDRIVAALLAAVNALIDSLSTLITDLLAQIEDIILQLQQAIEDAVEAVILYLQSVYEQIAAGIAAVGALVNDIISAFNSVVALLNSQTNIAGCVTASFVQKPPKSPATKKADEGAKKPVAPPIIPPAPI